MGLYSKIFGTYSERQIKKQMQQINMTEQLASTYAKLSDAEMAERTLKFKKEIADGKELDAILPDAFALVREAADRVLGKRPFKVQLICGLLLHQGRIAEMKTGEGKTLVAVLPSYLNALTGKGVHIVTVNDYLARIGCEEMGRVHEYLGLSTGLVVHDQSRAQKQAAYNCDITYGTNNEFGFDYLRDNMVTYRENLVQRGHNFAIVDEVDSILIDEARTPLIISGQGEKTDELYDQAEKLCRTMKVFVIKELDSKELNDDIDADYIVDEKARSTTLTAAGVEKAERFFGIDNLSDPANADISHHIYQAIRAHGIMKRDIDYVVKNDEVLIVDSFTGRIMPGRRYSDGLHQAIEAKENVQIQKENRTIATITFQNYFRMYTKLSGMTGTALTEETEFREIYNLDVVEVPTNKPMIRVDHPDVVYKTKNGKDKAIIEQIKKCHEKGQPVLVGTVSIEKSEALSGKLKACGIKHTVLNAKHHELEAEIVAQAGKLGAVTISTNMAGRGTDILLGGNAEHLAKAEMRKQGYDEEIIGKAVGSLQDVPEDVLAAREVYRELFKKFQDSIKPEAEQVCKAGGLFVIGTERHESRRIDNQLRGRSGRQGDPGESRFFLSLEDDLMRKFGGERVQSVMQTLGIEDDVPIENAFLTKTIESSQRKVEGRNFSIRKNVLDFDDVMSQQRMTIYSQRAKVLDGEDVSDYVKNMIKETIEENVKTYCSDDYPENWNLIGLREHFANMLTKEDDFNYTTDDLNTIDRKDIVKLLQERADALYAEREEMFGTENMREIERICLLKVVDTKWMDHIDAMEELKRGIYLRSYAQRDPVVEYRIEGFAMFDEMIAAIREDTARLVLTVKVRIEEPLEREQVMKPDAENAGSHTTVKKSASEKVGRNDPCPCGSGKKYKFCCGR